MEADFEIDLKAYPELRALFDAHEAEWIELTQYFFTPTLREYLEGVEAGRIRPADTPAWMRRVKKAQEEAMERLASEDGRAARDLLATMVMAPGFVDFAEETMRAVWNRADKRVAEHQFGRLLQRWFAQLWDSYPQARRELATIAASWNVRKHETFPQAMATLRHLEGVEDLDDEDDEDADIQIDRLTRSLMSAFSELAELRYRAYINFLWDLLHAVGRVPAGQRWTFGKRSIEIERVFTADFPAFLALVDTSVFRIRNANMHVSFDTDPETAQVILLRDDGTEQMRFDVDALAERYGELVEVVLDEGGGFRALEAIVMRFSRWWMPGEFAKWRDAIEEHRGQPVQWTGLSHAGAEE